MKVIERGHRYELATRKPEGGPSDTTQTVQFLNTEPGHETDGTTTQEICRMLIDRTIYCNNCLPHRVNEEIVYHFRKIIALHEARALERKVDKDGWEIEHAAVDDTDGHLFITGTPHEKTGHDGNRSLKLDPVTEPSNPTTKPKRDPIVDYLNGFIDTIASAVARRYVDMTDTDLIKHWYQANDSIARLRSSTAWSQEKAHFQSTEFTIRSILVRRNLWNTRLNIPVVPQSEQEHVDGTKNGTKIGTGIFRSRPE